MTNLLQKIVNEFDQLWQLLSFIWWDWWIPDEEWVGYIVQWGCLANPIIKSEFNRSFWHLELYKMILTPKKKKWFWNLLSSEVCGPKLFLQYSEESAIDCQPTQQEFLHWLHVSTIDTSTAFCWLKNLGFCFDIQKGYFNDHHKNPENVLAWKEFIKSYFSYELYTHHWVQVPINDAKQFESETDLKGNHLMKGMWAYKLENENGTLMQEYHVDCHLEFFDKYVTSVDCQKFGRNLSVCIPDSTHPKLLIG